jgi:hypothetical protein
MELTTLAAPLAWSAREPAFSRSKSVLTCPVRYTTPLMVFT